MVTQPIHLSERSFMQRSSAKSLAVRTSSKFAGPKTNLITNFATSVWKNLSNETNKDIECWHVNSVAKINKKHISMLDQNPMYATLAMESREAQNLRRLSYRKNLVIKSMKLLIKNMIKAILGNLVIKSRKW